jgi:hypothetical protein
MEKQPIVSLSSDFGIGSKDIGVMEASVLRVCKNARILHLCHSIPSFNLIEAARVFEAVYYLPLGVHVCVVDPGVGTERKGLIIETCRGDFLVGPDNGILLPASKLLGGIKKVHEISNEKFFLKPVSFIFHGRDIFAPVAGHLSNGIKINEFGKKLSVKELVKAPFEEAREEKGQIKATVIHVNSFGSIQLNIKHEEMKKFARIGEKIVVELKGKKLRIPFVKTFGSVKKGKPLILLDDFFRVEIALNQGNFSKKFLLKTGDKVILKKHN